MDRISSLPDGVLSHILSFLPLKKAARTSVLSKRWRILFAFTPNLDLDGNEVSGQSFMDFVDRVLTVSGNSPIKKFSIRCIEVFDPARINRWICDVLNRGVLNCALHLGLDAEDAKDGYSLPFEIFTCKTLLKLKLAGFSIDVLPEDAFLPALESLVLKSVQFCSLHVCVFQKLLSACPVLEDLVMNDLNWEQWKWSRVVSSPSLERLTIKRTLFYGFDGSDFGSITFHTPNVTYLYYSDFVPGSYPTVNLDSLVEASLDLTVTVDHTWDSCFADEGDPITSNPTNLIKGLRNVEIMNLLSHESLEMFYFFREAIPMFENLFHLSFTPGAGCSWRGVPFMLNNSPNLETLIIKGPLHHDASGYGCSGYSCLLSCPVKVLKITEYLGTTGDVEQLRHFLGKLSCLELLEVDIFETRNRDELQITKELLMLPRASSKCKIKVN
ncbi:unnamed protein product [Arabidopsis lyrata]|uniref:F-box/LRR-repeat protein At3g58980-like n=1 Tax=Arabidopsis lyrata subsp. lyrata TaxID=81972 RepID=UPI000A29C715|nr:F-box/LRR-repeat protein At3g58980-like [Arabidopsis lyrata subsp. lyrata]CAH8269112.1 unnamed protein product [Arabidopsis lyrata]|eukprot:XP_020880551.1 F-box/LRR-repeat protein At3g58980-like [Arabidopsis lyrata subsp. lyrata]